MPTAVHAWLELYLCLITNILRFVYTYTVQCMRDVTEYFQLGKLRGNTSLLWTQKKTIDKAQEIYKRVHRNTVSCKNNLNSKVGTDLWYTPEQLSLVEHTHVKAEVWVDMMFQLCT